MEPYYDDGQVTMYHGDVRAVLRALPAESGRRAIGIDLSPEYLGMAVKRAGGQLSLELTVEAAG